MATKSIPLIEANEIATTAAFVLPVRHLIWITNEAARIASEQGGRPNKSDVVRTIVENAMRNQESTTATPERVA